jgi:farnesyl diphosphate synthase
MGWKILNQMTEDSINQWVSEHQKRVDLILQDFFNTQENTLLKNACEYALLNGGKRLRSLLIYAVGEDEKILNKFHLDQLALSVELIHAYSLTHDDLPSMDDDSLRRGKPSCHIKFNEGQAILAGDALQSLAFQVLSDKNLKIHNDTKIQIINTLSQSIGLNGMALGQSMDIDSNKMSSSIEALEKLQELKTGALIKASCVIPFLLSKNYDEMHMTDIANIGDLIGKIYQITDDILDVESNTEILGKTAGKDKKNNKMTYISLVGREEAIKIKASIFKDLNKSIEQFPRKLKILQNLAHYIYKRAF